MPDSDSSIEFAADEHSKDARLPSLFAVDTHLIAWQGLSATTPANWNLALFSGDHGNGHLRIDDEDGPRLELRWEKPSNSVDLQRSIDDFMERIRRQLKKQKEEFALAEDTRIIAKSKPQTARRKDGLVHFGWSGERDAIVGQGWGAAWQCPDCGRVVVAHVIGRGNERAEKAQRLTGEILTSTRCHGSGGWQTWSVFDLSVDIPEEFTLSRAKLLTGRLELEWARVGEKSLWVQIFKWARRDERLLLERWSLADMILQHESLLDWARRTVGVKDKSLLWRNWEEAPSQTYGGVKATGVVKDLRRRGWFALVDRVRRSQSRESEVRAWRCEKDNKVFALASDLTPQNAHVVTDILESLECH